MPIASSADAPHITIGPCAHCSALAIGDGAQAHSLPEAILSGVRESPSPGRCTARHLLDAQGLQAVDNVVLSSSAPVLKGAHNCGSSQMQELFVNDTIKFDLSWPLYGTTAAYCSDISTSICPLSPPFPSMLVGTFFIARCFRGGP